MVEVSATALGVYRLKGVTELVHVVRIMPAVQEPRSSSQGGNKLEVGGQCRLGEMGVESDEGATSWRWVGGAGGAEGGWE